MGSATEKLRTGTSTEKLRARVSAAESQEAFEYLQIVKLVAVGTEVGVGGRMGGRLVG